MIRRPDRFPGRSLPSAPWVGAALIVVLSSCATSSASVRTPFDDEVAPRTDGSRILRLTYEMEETGESIPYALYLPADFTPEREWPLMVGLVPYGLPFDFLMGFQGILDAADRYGYVLVSPLGYVRASNYGDTGVRGLDQLAEQDFFNVVALVSEAYNADPDRTYLWGASAGSTAAWDFATREPARWNSAVAMLAAPDNFLGNVPEGREVDGMRALVFIGTEDTDGQGRAAAGRMRDAGVASEYLEVPGGHFLWLDADQIDPLFRFFEGERVGEAP